MDDLVLLLREALKIAGEVLETASCCEWCYSEAAPAYDKVRAALAATEPGKV